MGNHFDGFAVMVEIGMDIDLVIMADMGEKDLFCGLPSSPRVLST